MAFENVGYRFLGPDVEAVAEILTGRFYFVTFRRREFLKVDRESHFFSTDLQFIYNNFFEDFGPLNLAQLYRYWLIVREKLTCPNLQGKRIIHWTTTDFKKRANAAFLVGSFAILHLGMAPEHAHRLLLCGKHPFVPFQDASQGISKYRIKLIDCFNAIAHAVHLGFFNLQDFDLAHYEHYEKVQNGDISWIVPEKLLALSAPGRGFGDGCTPETYFPYFRLYDVKHLVRLNRPNFCDSKFISVGIKVHEMFFMDGTVPSKEIVYKFLGLTEEVKGPIAVHCKAGLGRTGCLVGAYLVKHYGMPALEAVAWMRICRPGCVIGYQQTWLEKAQRYLLRSGQLYRLRVMGDIDKFPRHTRGVYSLRKHSCSPTKSAGGNDSISINLRQQEKHFNGVTFQSAIKFVERRKRKSSKEKTHLKQNEPKCWVEETPQQGDWLHRRKWEYTLAKDVSVSSPDKLTQSPSPGRLTTRTNISFKK